VLSDEFSRTRVRPEHILAETDKFQHWTKQSGTVGQKERGLLVRHHFSTVVRNTLPPCRESVCFPGLVQDARNAFLFPVLGSVPS